jgi:hypothetical protein
MIDLRFFASLRMTSGFDICFKLGLRNISGCESCAGWY